MQSRNDLDGRKGQNDNAMSVLLDGGRGGNWGHLGWSLPTCRQVVVVGLGNIERRRRRCGYCPSPSRYCRNRSRLSTPLLSFRQGYPIKSSKPSSFSIPPILELLWIARIIADFRASSSRGVGDRRRSGSKSAEILTYDVNSPVNPAVISLLPHTH